MQIKLENLLNNISSLETKIESQNDQINEKDEELASSKHEL